MAFRPSSVWLLLIFPPSTPICPVSLPTLSAILAYLDFVPAHAAYPHLRAFADASLPVGCTPGLPDFGLYVMGSFLAHSDTTLWENASRAFSPSELRTPSLYLFASLF